MPSNKELLAGRIISGLVTAFMLFDGIFKLPKPAPSSTASRTLGYDPNIAIPSAVLALLRDSLRDSRELQILGAILLTGYLGGAVATHVRVNDPLFTHILVPVYLGVLAWLGLYLRDDAGA
jgi:hypothetical protein